MDKEELEKIMSLVFEVMASDKLAKAIADMSFNIVGELQKKGFDKKEAIQILCSLNYNNK